MSSGNSFHNACSTREHNLNIAERQKLSVTNNAAFSVFPMVINQYLNLFLHPPVLKQSKNMRPPHNIITVGIWQAITSVLVIL